MPSIRASPGIMVFRVCSISTTGAFRLFLKRILITYSSNRHATNGSPDDICKRSPSRAGLVSRSRSRNRKGGMRDCSLCLLAKRCWRRKSTMKTNWRHGVMSPLSNISRAELTTQYIFQSHISFTKFSTPKLLSQLSSDPKPQPHSPSTFFFPSPSTQPLHPSRDSQHRHNPKLLPNSSSE